MKKTIILLAFLAVSAWAKAQLKKDGTPDRRYETNKHIYGNTYSSSNLGGSTTPMSYQRGYERNGSYVEGSFHTTPNATNRDNWNTTGNTNPFTGSQGTRARDYSDDADKYGQGQTIHTGPRGGQYYQNSNNNQIYVPKRYH